MEYKEKNALQTPDDGHDDPSNWKLGILYYNKKDKRLFPPKRNNWMGWTVNFANPFSILAFLGILVLICALIDLCR
jgi:uncharacterized membrane protein